MDDVYSWDFNEASNYQQYDKAKARCANGDYLLELVSIRPGKESVNDKGTTIENAPFDFKIVAQAFDNQPVKSKYEGVDLTAWINVRARGKESHLRKLAAALLGVDPAELTTLHPSDLIGQQCWASVSSKKGVDRENKPVVYTNIDKDSFSHDLPEVADMDEPAQPPIQQRQPVPKSSTAPARPAPTAQHPTTRQVATASRQPQPLPTAAQLKKDNQDLFDEDPDPAPEDEEV
jgi:DNA segregation ATPase FtsK/SpoIIIE-like protein